MGFVAKMFVNSRADWLFHKWFGASKLLDTVKYPDKGKILELGCGVGIATAFIAGRFSKAEITAVDCDKSQIELADERKQDKNVEFIIGDAANLKFKDDTFDLAFEFFAFHHIPEYEMAVRETQRVLKQGGKFIVMDVALKSFGILGKLMFFEPVKFTKKEFVEKLEKSGFRISRAKGNIFFVIEAVKV